jgi:hypothetical protein
MWARRCWWVYVRVVTEAGKLEQQVRSFGATTPDLLALREWLVLRGVMSLRP